MAFNKAVYNCKGYLRTASPNILQMLHSVLLACRRFENHAENLRVGACQIIRSHINLIVAISGACRKLSYSSTVFYGLACQLCQSAVAVENLIFRGNLILILINRHSFYYAEQAVAARCAGVDSRLCFIIKLSGDCNVYVFQT